MTKKIIKKILALILFPFIKINNFFLERYLNAKIIDMHKHQLFILAQDQFGSVIYNVVYALIWKKIRGEVAIVILSPDYKEIIKLIRLFDKNITIITPKRDIFISKFTKPLKIYSIVQKFIIIPTYRNISFNFPNHIFLFGMHPNNRFEYNPYLDEKVISEFKSEKLKKAYLLARKSIDANLKYKYDMHNLLLCSQKLKILSISKKDFTSFLGIPEDYVVINVNTKFNKAWGDDTNNRSVNSVETIKKTINYLISKGYFVIMHGRKEQPNLKFPKYFFNYAHSKITSFKNDALLIYYAKFFITSKSGVEALAMLGNTPTLGLNYTDLSSMAPILKFRYIPKHLTVNGKQISWENYLNFIGFYERNIPKGLSSKIKYKELSFPEIKYNLEEFIKLLDDPSQNWLKFSKLQKKYKKSLKNYHLDLNNIPGIPTNYYIENES